MKVIFYKCVVHNEITFLVLGNLLKILHLCYSFMLIILIETLITYIVLWKLLLPQT